MIIAKSSINDYLDKKLEDYRWVKELSLADMQAELKEIAPKFKFKTKPFEHQLACLLLGIYNPQFLFLVDMGGGKSKIVLDTLTYHRKKKRLIKTLVVVPSPVNISDFAEQVAVHSRIPCIELTGNRNERLNKLSRFDDGIAVINYAGLMSMSTENIDHRMMPVPSYVREFSDHFDSIVLDEIHLCKNHKTLTFRLCMMISRRYKYRYGLTGTPMGRDPMDLWAQFKIIDDGETLGNNITMYRNAFFKAKQNYWGGFEYVFDKKLTDKLHTRLSNCSIRYELEEMNTLPPVTRRVQHLDLPFENRTYYEQAIQGFVEAKGNKVATDNSFIRLRQISSGYFKYKLDDIETVLVDFENNPKLESLMTLIEGLPFSSKAVVVHEYVHSGRLIENALKERKIKFTHLEGATKDKAGARNKFKKDPNCKIFIMNWMSGSMGINLQEANYMFFFESPVGPIARQQTERRIVRTGQKKHSFIYDFTASKVEQKIQSFLAEGKNLFQEIIDGRVNINDLR